MSEEIPAAFPEWTRSTFDRYDLARLFSNPVVTGARWRSEPGRVNVVRWELGDG